MTSHENKLVPYATFSSPEPPFLLVNDFLRRAALGTRMLMLFIGEAPVARKVDKRSTIPIEE